MISESADEQTYKVLPTTQLVMGFQYQGRLRRISGGSEVRLSSAGITGLANSFKTFTHSGEIGSILVYFTETGFRHFCSLPANELFNQSISLDLVFSQSSIEEIEDKLGVARTDRLCIINKTTYSVYT